MDDDQMTDDEQLVHSQKQCLKELKLSIDAFIGKTKTKKGSKTKKKKVNTVTIEKKKDMVFNYMNAEILKGAIVPINFEKNKN